MENLTFVLRMVDAIVVFMQAVGDIKVFGPNPIGFVYAERVLDLSYEVFFRVNGVTLAENP